MVEKMYELKAKYEAEISRLQLKIEVLNDLFELAPQPKEETVELLEQSESEEVLDETETVDELENL